MYCVVMDLFCVYCIWSCVMMVGGLVESLSGASLSVVIAREMARHRLRRIPFIGVPRAAIRARQPFRAPQEARHMPQMAQLADFMRFQAYGAAPAAVRA